MKIIARLFTLIVFLLPAISFAIQCPGTDPDSPVSIEITDPEVFQWEYINDATDPHWTGTMEIAKASMTLNNGDTITTRVYRQEGGCDSIPGPTINMTPGEKYVLRFKNTLPYDDPVAAHNVFKDPNISNLHTHGLHISGETPGDDVTRSFEGGFGGDFVYDILEDHMGGTFWYHAHHHGSTYLQVSGGAFGLIVIDDSADGIPPAVAAMEERQLVIAYLDPDVAGTGGDTLISGSVSPTWTVNGQINGNLNMPSGEWQHFRILLADRDAKPKTVSIGSSCDVQLLARDGVWRTVAPLNLADNSIKITGASRADLAVRCSTSSTISVGSTQVASIAIDGAGNADPSPGTNWTANRPDYLRDLREDRVDNTETVNMGARTINGSKYDNIVPTFALQADGLQRWSLKGARNHPFHLHIYHVQIDGSCADYEDGEYYDVVANNCNILFDLDETSSSVYEGRTIMHCHILEHEDQGAMGWTDVLGGLSPPTFPDGFGYTDYFGTPPTGGNRPAAPTALIATAVSTNQIDLSWTDNSSDETIFDIFRSGDGANFSYWDSVSAEITAYSDTSLSAGSTLHYRVRASNANGDSDFSNDASDTTQSGGSATSVQLVSVTVTSVSAPAGKGQKLGRATVIVQDDVGGLVENATVSGEFSGDMIETGLSAGTDQGGSVTFDTTDTFKGNVNLTFCVNSVSHPDLNDYAGPEVCGSL